MARTDAGRALTNAYRAQLAAVRAKSIHDLLLLYGMLDYGRARETYPAWSTAVATLIARDRQLVTATTFGYLTGLRAVEIGPGSATLVDPDPLDPEALATSLRVTSLATYFRGVRNGMLPAQARATAFVTNAGSSTRMILNAGRSATVKSARADGRSQYWDRVTSSHPCPFCSDLAGREARVESSVDFPAHDHCLCSAEPVYR